MQLNSFKCMISTSVGVCIACMARRKMMAAMPLRVVPYQNNFPDMDSAEQVCSTVSCVSQCGACIMMYPLHWAFFVLTGTITRRRS